VFAGDAMGRVYAVDPDGRRRWAMPLEAGPCTPVPGPDGTVYAACANGRLYALAAHPGGR
jgi:outer membrane protein assembly factor BamB